MADCLFCAIVAGDVPADIVRTDEHTAAFRDISPQAPVHVLVIPREHSANLWEIDPGDLAATARAAQVVATRVRDRLGADGVNLINACGPLAWQTVFHFHIHVVPRYEGDPLKLPWVPAPGDPEAIAATAEELRYPGLDVSGSTSTPSCWPHSVSCGSRTSPPAASQVSASASASSTNR